MSGLTGGHCPCGARHPWPPPRESSRARGRLVLAMALLSLSQELRQGRDVQVAESSSGKPRLDLLEQPAVAVWIAERGERAIACMVGCGPADSTARAVALELSSRRRGVEHLADPGTTGDELVACSLDLGDDQVEALGRARRGRRDVRAELDRAPRAGRRELDDPEAIIESEIGVQPPPQALVEALGAIDVGHRNDDDLELQIAAHRRGHHGLRGLGMSGTPAPLASRAFAAASMMTVATAFGCESIGT